MIRNYCVFNSILSRACYLKKNPASCIKTRSRDLENEAKGSRNRREHPIRQISPVLLSRGETEVHQRKNAQTMRIFVFYSTPRKRWMFHTRAEVSFFLFPFFFFFSPPPLLVGAIVGNRKPRTGLFTWRRHAMLAKLLQMCTVSMTLSRRKHLSRYFLLLLVQKENGRNISNSRFFLEIHFWHTRVGETNYRSRSIDSNRIGWNFISSFVLQRFVLNIRNINRSRCFEPLLWEDNKDPRMGYYYVVRKMFGEETRVGGGEARRVGRYPTLVDFCNFVGK